MDINNLLLFKTCTHSEIKLVKANKNMNSNTSNKYENKE